MSGGAIALIIILVCILLFLLGDHHGKGGK